MKSLTMKERMTRFIQGRELDRVPFAQYDIMVPREELWSVVGRENVGLITWVQAFRFEHPNCQIKEEKIKVANNNGLRRTLITPSGQLTEIIHFDPVFDSPATKEHFIKDISDYAIFLEYLRDITVVPDFTSLEKVLADLGDDGLPHCFLTRTPFQQMWVVWASLEQLIIHMMDAPELVEECMDLLGRQLIDIAKAVYDAPIPYIVIGDNITAPAIGLHYFEKYCVPYYNQVADIFSDRNIPLVVHTDGDLKPLWKAIGDSKIVGLDSFSPPPDNDTSAEEAVKMWPDKKLMLNFPSSVHLKSDREVYSMAMEILQQAGQTGRLQIQISENVPPGVWKKSYPQIIKAINDYKNSF